MSADPYSKDVHERDLAVAIINQLNLSADTVQKIRESMQQTGISFTDAAIALGLMTTEQLHDIIVAQQRSERDNVSMVESAMRKMSLRRSFVATEPQGHAAASKRLIIAHDAYSPRSEKIRGLRTELQLRFGTTTQGTIFAIVSAHSSQQNSQSLLHNWIAEPCWWTWTFVHLSSICSTVQTMMLDFHKPSLETETHIFLQSKAFPN